MKSMKITLQKGERIIKGYPTRQIRLSDKVWEKFKKKKEQSGQTWCNFVRTLI